MRRGRGPEALSAVDPSWIRRLGRWAALPVLLTALAFAGYRAAGNWLGLSPGTVDKAVYVPAQDFGFRITTWSPVCEPGVGVPNDRMVAVCRLSQGETLAGIAFLRRLPGNAEAAMETSFVSFAQYASGGRNYAVIGSKTGKVLLGSVEATVWHRKLWVEANIRHITVVFWPDHTGPVPKLVTLVLYTRRQDVAIEGAVFDGFLAGVAVPGSR